MKIKQEINGDVQTESNKKKSRKRKNIETESEIHQSAKKSKSNKRSKKAEKVNLSELNDSQNISNDQEEIKANKRSSRKRLDSSSQQGNPVKKKRDRKVKVKQEPKEKSEKLEKEETVSKKNSFRSRRKSVTNKELNNSVKKSRVKYSKFKSDSQNVEERMRTKSNTLVYEDSFNEFKSNLVADNNISLSCSKTVEDVYTKSGIRLEKRNSLKQDQDQPAKLDKLVISIKKNRITNGKTKHSKGEKMNHFQIKKITKTYAETCQTSDGENDVFVPENSAKSFPIEESEISSKKLIELSPAVSSTSGLNDSREGELVFLDEEDSSSSSQTSFEMRNERKDDDLQKNKSEGEDSVVDMNGLTSRQMRGQDSTEKNDHHISSHHNEVDEDLKKNNLTLEESDNQPCDTSLETISEPIETEDQNLKTKSNEEESSIKPNEDDDDDSESSENFEQIFDEIVDHVMAH